MLQFVHCMQVGRGGPKQAQTTVCRLRVWGICALLCWGVTVSSFRWKCPNHECRLWSCWMPSLMKASPALLFRNGRDPRILSTQSRSVTSKRSSPSGFPARDCRQLAWSGNAHTPFAWPERLRAEHGCVSIRAATDANQIGGQTKARAELEDGEVVNKVPSNREEGLTIIGSRGSQLAMVQSEWVRDTITQKFADSGRRFVIYEVASKGDVMLDIPLSAVASTGVFTKELEMMLLNGDIDLAVHSLKDCLPPSEGLWFCAISKREDPVDVLVPNPSRPKIMKCRTLRDLPPGAVVGTSSSRRKAQVKTMRPDLVIRDVRGNVQSRLAKLETDYDCIILAKAGIQRLGLFEGPDPIVAYDISLSEMLHAVGQGALAVECRKDNVALSDMVRIAVEHPETRICVDAELSFLRSIGSGGVPHGVSTEIKEGVLNMVGGVFAIDGSQSYRAQAEGPVENAVQLGRRVAEILVEKGAGKLIRDLAHGDNIARPK